MKLKTDALTAILTLPLLFSTSMAAAPAIGVATASGKFTLDRASHRSNATLFEGNTFDSGASDLELRLNSGTTMQLGVAARGTVFHDRVQIGSGGGDVRPGAGYTIEALKLLVKPMKEGSVARIVVSGGQVRVGALRGEFQVVNDKGVVLATVAQGDADAFTPLTGQVEAVAAGSLAAGAAAGAAVAAGAGAAAGISTGVIIAGVAVAGAGAAAGISVAATSGTNAPTLSPTAR